ncbi:hypothetical protein ACFQVA_41755 [Actinomadura keratinilytica]
MGALNGYIVQLVQQRMADPSGTDLVSRLVQGRIDGEPMQLHEILYSTFNLLIAASAPPATPSPTASAPC